MTKLAVLAAALVLAGTALATIARRRGTLAPGPYRLLPGLAAVVALWGAAAVVRGRPRVLVVAAAIGATWLLMRTLFPARDR